MSKICTSLEQSKKLVELGIDVNAADMYWSLVNKNHPPIIGKYCAEYDGMQLPAWSLSALLNIINSIKGWYPGIDAQVEGNKWQICMFSRETGSDTSLSSMNEELIDVCYEIVIKLHEQNLI